MRGKSFPYHFHYLSLPLIHLTSIHSLKQLIKKYLRKEDEGTNYCRNRDHDPQGPWCVKKGANDNEEEVGYCDTENSCISQLLKCKRTQLGTEYRGNKNVTQSGRPCAFWNTRMSNLDPSIIKAKNFCRNPDNDIDGPWCFVNQKEGERGETWESCGIKWCHNDNDAEKYM